MYVVRRDEYRRVKTAAFFCLLTVCRLSSYHISNSFFTSRDAKEIVTKTK
jgi:hypothetical protein